MRALAKDGPGGASPAVLVVLASLALLAPAASGHGLITLNVQVPPSEACPTGGGRCLETVEPQPPLHVGDSVGFLVWNDDDEPHRILVAANASADPSHAGTPADVAIAATDVPANGSRDAGEIVVPEGTRVLYVWCDLEGHEAAGEWMRVPVEPAAETDETPAPLAGVLATVLAVALWRGRRPGNGRR